MSQPNWADKTIFTGDNLPILRGMNSESVDLIYLDPPFNSKTDYAAPIGSKAAGAEFKDTWALSDIDAEWINLVQAKHPALWRVLLAAMTPSDKSYLAYMAVRLLEMRRVLKLTGCIYVHCDPTMSHYLKLVMDAIFGRQRFRNEIIWYYRKWTNTANYFQRNHDILLCYGNGGTTLFNKQFGELTKRQRQIRQLGYNSGSSGGQQILRVYDRAKAAKKIAQAEREGRSVYYIDEPLEGSPIPDVWTDISALNGRAREREGYPTQKPLALLRRIIFANSNEGDVLLDPFCGCATACVEAEIRGRQWVGIDISPKAIELVNRRLQKPTPLGIGPMFHNRLVTTRTDIPQRTDLGPLPRYNSPQNRTTLYGQQEGHCAGCGEHFQSRHLEVDHIISRGKGGTDHIENLQLLCGNCNRIKGDRGMEYLRVKLQLST